MTDYVGMAVVIYVNLRTGKSHRVINGSALCGATLAGSAPSRHVPDVSCKLCRRIEAGMVKTAPTRVDYREGREGYEPHRNQWIKLSGTDLWHRISAARTLRPLCSIEQVVRARSCSLLTGTP